MHAKSAEMQPTRPGPNAPLPANPPRTVSAPARRSAALAVLALAGAVPAAAGELKPYNSRYYVLYTDLPAELIPEIDLRITAMAETYADRTRGFAGKITHKFPFYLYRDPRDYYAAGGKPGSGGMFDGKRLMAIAGERLSDETWRVIQHEGFHQFVHAVIRGNFPVWVDEGMAEYFGEAVFTGDGFITGVIPAERAARIRDWIAEGRTLSVKGMMTLSHDAWSGNLNVVNYDQAWSMIQFLAHAFGGRYQKPLNGFINDVSSGRNWEQAWTRNFGQGTSAFERQWREFWLAQPAQPTPERHAQASVATLTSFLARAVSQRQTFSSAEEFFAAARAGQLRAHPDDWLPSSLLKRELKRCDRLGSWELRRRPEIELVCRLADGTEVVGKFRLDGRRVKRGGVSAEIRPGR